MAESNDLSSPSYAQWLGELKDRVQQVQTKAAISVNRELLTFYWELGCEIIEKQKTANWGSGFLKQLSIDLSNAFPSLKGFSYRNIRLVRQWCHFYLEHSPNLATSCCQIKENSQPVENETPTELATACGQFRQQAVAKLPEFILESIISFPWGQNFAIISKCSSIKEALYYVRQTLTQGWSRSAYRTSLLDPSPLAASVTSNQKETPGPLTRKRSRKGSRGQRGKYIPAKVQGQTLFVHCSMSPSL